MESDNTPHINSLGANPELIHQVALTTRLLQAHPTVNSFHPPEPKQPLINAIVPQVAFVSSPLMLTSPPLSSITQQ